MNKKFFLALMLASGMAFAQSSGSSPGSSDQQQPSTQQPQTSSGQQSPASTGQSSLTGCLKGSDSGWVIVAEGQSTPVTGDSATLGPHNGHQVQVKGTQASDGSFQVTDILMIADTCTKQQDTSASSGTGAAAGAAAGAVTGAASDAGHAAQNAASDASNAVQNAPSSAAGAASDAAHATQSAADSAASSAANASQSAADNAAGSAQNATTPASSGTMPQTPTDQSANATQGAHHKLPQSASPLPLLGLLGLGSLVSGLIARRKK